MKEQLQNKLVEILTGIQAAVGKASDFAMEQLPDIAMQYVAWGRANESIHMLVYILFAILGVALIVIAAKSCNKRRDTDGWEGPALLAGGLMTFFGVLAAMINLSTFLMVWFAPKVWLLKEIARLIK